MWNHWKAIPVRRTFHFLSSYIMSAYYHHQRAGSRWEARTKVRQETKRPPQDQCIFDRRQVQEQHKLESRSRWRGQSRFPRRGWRTSRNRSVWCGGPRRWGCSLAWDLDERSPRNINHTFSYTNLYLAMHVSNCSAYFTEKLARFIFTKMRN